MFENTIAAISTSLQDGAISIIRLSGDKAIEITQKIFDRNIMNAKSHTIHYGFIIDTDKNPVDEVLISIFRAPKTYTREDIVEINCHGGTFITRKILSMILSSGAELAKPGEFTQRAFYHGRIDLSQAEAVQDMIEASNNTAASMAIHGIKGSVKKLLQPLIDDLMDIIAQIEVNIDYPEYTDELEVTENLMHEYLDDITKELNVLVSGAKNGRLIKEGVNVAIIGKPNVGKSSILNSLLDEEKAIVTDIPGTTRDIVEGTITLNGVAINFIDTAGIRETTDIVEKIGVDKSKKTADNADIILLVLNNNEEMTNEELTMLDKYNNERLLVFVNKMDLEKKLVLPETIKDVTYGNTIDLDGLNTLKEAISNKLNLGSIVNKDMSYLCNLREIDLVNKAEETLKNAQNNLEAGYSVDIIEIDLKAAWNYLGEIMGDSYEGELVDKIFSNFCLGK